MTRGLPDRPSRGVAVSATQAQNNFGQVLDQARADGPVFITRYGRPEAVVLSIEAYDALTGTRDVRLDELEAEFDQAIAAMRSIDHREAVDALFTMDSDVLAEAFLHAFRAES